MPDKKPTRKRAAKKGVRKRAKPNGPTIGEVTEKISALKSNIAITDMVIVHLETHYQGTGTDEPEEYVTREDYARVSPDHIEDYIAALQEGNEVAEKELEQWESTPVKQPPTTSKPRRKPKNDSDTH